MADFKSISETTSVIEMYEVVAAKLNDNSGINNSHKPTNLKSAQASSDLSTKLKFDIRYFIPYTKVKFQT